MSRPVTRPELTRDAWAWSQECSRRAATAGISFEWDATVPGPCTDGSTVRVPPLPVDATAEDFTVLRGAVIHECGHILRPEAFAILKRENIAMGSPLWACFNIVEDAAQERAIAEVWRGDRASLGAMHGAIIARQIRDAAKADAGSNGPVSEDAHKLCAALDVSLLSAADWSPDMERMSELHANAMDGRMPGTAEVFATLRAESWHEKIAQAGDVDGAWQVARDIYARLFPNKPESENKSPAKGKAGEGDGDGGEAVPGKGKAGKQVGGTIPWQLIFHSDHDSDALGVACPSRIDWAGKDSRGAPTFYTEQTVTRPIATGRDAANASNLKFPAALVGTVRRMLQARSRVRWEHEKLDGRIDARNLQRVILPRVGDGEYNRKVFRRKGESLALDCAITILVDSSGSMSGEKYRAAAEAAMSLFDLCAVALRVPCEVLGFTTESQAPAYFTFKTFAERAVNRETVAARMLAVDGSGTYRMECNADGDALLWAAGRMKGRREARRIIIVLSDGSPSRANNRGDSDANLAAAVKAVRARGECEVYGIGVMDTNVRRYYSPTAPVVERACDVPAALIAVLGDVMQRAAK